MEKKQTFTDSELLQYANQIEDRIEFSGRTKVVRGFQKIKNIKFGYHELKKRVQPIHDIYEKWANV